MSINTHNLMINFGKHEGQPWTRIPVSYLRWLVNEPKMRPEAKEIAKAELKRRGTTVPTDLEISGHAIDSASLRLRRSWHQTALDDKEGLHAWLYRMASEALETSIEKLEEIEHRGIKFVFVYGEIYPTLKTVMPGKNMPVPSEIPGESFPSKPIV